MVTDKVFLASFGCTAATGNTGLVAQKAADEFAADILAVDSGALPYLTISGDTAGAGTNSGLLARYQDIYDDYWGGPGGDWINRALPCPGNHDETANGHADAYGGYWEYWDGQRQGGAVRPDSVGLQGGSPPSGRYWYDVDLLATDGNSYWKLISLNDETLDNATNRDDMLAAFQLMLDDAEANGQDVVVIHHQPLFQIVGNSYGQVRQRYIWGVLQDWTAGKKFIINAHIHGYSRMKPLKWNGATNFDTDPDRGRIILTEADWKNNEGIIEIVSALGGQDPFAVGTENHWASVADATGLRPDASEGTNKAVVTGPVGVSGEPPDGDTDSDGQVGHPYGITGLTLGPGYARIQFYGNTAVSADPADVTIYDDYTLTWTDDDIIVPPPPPPGPEAEISWYPSRCGGGGGDNAGTTSPHVLGHGVSWGDISGPQVTKDGAKTWTGGREGIPEASGTSDWTNGTAVEFDADPTKPNRVWGGAPAGLLVSNDGGYSWDLAAGSGQTPGGSAAIVFTDGANSDRPRVCGHQINPRSDGVILFVTNDGDVWRYEGYNAQGLQGTARRIATTAGIGESFWLDPNDSTRGYMAAGSDGIKRIRNLNAAGTDGGVVDNFSNAPAYVAEIAVVRLTQQTCIVWAACMGSGVKTFLPGTGTGAVTAAAVDETPEAGGEYCAVDAMIQGSATLVAVAKYQDIDSLWVSEDGGTTWVNAADWPLVNQNGGDPTNDAFFGFFGAGSGGPSGNKYTAQSTFSPEQIRIDRLDPTKIYLYGTQGVWLADRAAQRNYPCMQRHGVTTWGPIKWARNNEDWCIAGNNDHFQMGTFDKDASRWDKNERLPAGLPSVSKERGCSIAWGPNDELFLGRGDQGTNAGGRVVYCQNPDALPVMVDLGTVNGARPIAMDVVELSTKIRVVACFQAQGIYTRDFDKPLGATPNPQTGWVEKAGSTTAFSTLSGAGPGTARMGEVEISAADPDIAFALDRLKGLFRCTNFTGAADNWALIMAYNQNDERAGFISLDPNDVDRVALSLTGSGHKGAWITTNASTCTAATFARVEIEPDGSPLSVPGPIRFWGTDGLDVMDMGDPHKHWRSEDSGDTWINFADDTHDPQRVFRRTACKVTDMDVNDVGDVGISTLGPGIVVGIAGTVTTPPPADVPLSRIISVPSTLSLLEYDAGTTVAPSANKQLMAAVLNSDLDGTAPAPTAFTAFDVPWTQQETEEILDSGGRAHRLTCFTADTFDDGSGDTPATITVADISDQPTDPTANTTIYTQVTSEAIPANAAVVAWIISSDTIDPVIPTLDGWGLTWTQRDSVGFQPDANFRRISVFTAATGSSGPGADVLEATFANAQTGCLIYVRAFTSSDGSVPVIEQVEADDTMSTTAPTIDTLVALGDNSWVEAGFILARAAAAGTPGAGWNEIYDTTNAGFASPPTGFYMLSSLDPTMDASPSATWSAAAAVGIGVEISAPIAAGGATFDNTSPLAEFADAQDACLIEVYEVEGVQPGQIAQSTSADWGATTSLPTLSLDNPVAVGGQSVVAAMLMRPVNPPGWVAEPGWAGLQETGYAQPNAGLHVAGQAQATDRNYTPASGGADRWGGIIIEFGGTQLSIDQYTLVRARVGEPGLDLSTSVRARVSGQVVTILDSGTDDVDAASHDTLTISPSARDYVLALIESSQSGVDPPPHLLDGVLPWEELASVLYATASQTFKRRLSLFGAIPPDTTPTPGIVTMSNALTEQSMLLGVWPQSYTQHGQIQTALGSPVPYFRNRALDGQFDQDLCEAGTISASTDGYIVGLNIQPKTGSGSNRFGVLYTDIRDEIIAESGPLYTKLLDFRQQILDLPTYGILPIFLQFHSEASLQNPDPDAQPTSGTSDEYQEVFPLIWQLMYDGGVNAANLVYWQVVLNRNTYNGAKGGPGSWFPEDPKYYDLVGVDHYYRPTTWTPADDCFTSALDFARSKGKKIWIDETGADEGGPNNTAGAKAAWYNDLHAWLLSVKSEVAGVVFSHAEDGGNWFLDSILAGGRHQPTYAGTSWDAWAAMASDADLFQSTVSSGQVQANWKWIITQHENAIGVNQVVPGVGVGTLLSVLMESMNPGSSTYLGFAKAGVEDAVFDVDGTAWSEIEEVESLDPSGRLMAGIHLGEDLQPAAGSQASRIMGMFGVEIANQSVVSLSTRVRARIGTEATEEPVPEPSPSPTPVPRPRPLLPVHFEIGDHPVAMRDNWQGSHVIHDAVLDGTQGGFDTFTGEIPAKQYKKFLDDIQQGARVVGFTDEGLVWEGSLAAPPHVTEGVAKLSANGDQHRIRRKTQRLLFESRDYALWNPMDSEPYEFSMSSKFDVQALRGAIRITRTPDTYTSGQRGGAVFYAPGVNIKRLLFKFNKEGINDQFSLTVAGVNFPGTLNDIRTWNVSNISDGQPLEVDIAGYDLIAIYLFANTGINTETQRGRITLTQVKVRGIADTKDRYTTGMVAEYIGNRMGFNIDGVRDSGLNILPLDVEGNWADDVMDYVALMDDWTWEAEGENMVYQEWGTEEWLVSVETGAEEGLEPMELYSHVRVNFENLAGVPDFVLIEADPNPLAELGIENEFVMDLDDPQPNNTLPSSVARNMSNRLGLRRFQGPVFVTAAVRPDGTGDPYGIRAGRLLTITDWNVDENFQHRIAEANYSSQGTEVGIEMGLSAARIQARARLRRTRRGRR